MKHQARRVVSVAWPAFLCAAVLEIVVFAFVDPQSMHLLTGRELPLSDTATYSLAFFVFWAVAVAGGYLTLILYSSAEEVNARSVSGT
jgi:hypothetical protein